MNSIGINGKVLLVSSAIALSMSGTASAIEAGKAATSQAVMSARDNGPKRALLGGVFNCGSAGTKQEIGAVAGGVLGGVLGNRIAGRGSRTLGTLLGGALGAAAGSALGCKLQKSDQAKAERAMEEAVASNEDQSWQSDETGASGKVEVSQTATGASLSGIKFAKGVEPASGFTKIGSAYVSSGTANVRAAPGTSAKILGSLASGQRVWVPAAVSGQPWLLVSEDGVGQGYVSAPLLRKVTGELASGCKMVKQTIDVPGSGTGTETFQACKGKDGQWVMTRV
jgi:outer membrane lipoprotein SlyB